MAAQARIIRRTARVGRTGGHSDATGQLENSSAPTRKQPAAKSIAVDEQPW